MGIWKIDPVQSIPYRRGVSICVNRFGKLQGVAPFKRWIVNGIHDTRIYERDLIRAAGPKLCVQFPGVAKTGVAATKWGRIPI